MPTYEYACDGCRIIYQTRHGMNDPGLDNCPACASTLRKVLSAPSLNTGRHSSPTAAKYSKLSDSDEIAMEKDLQKVYETIWVPPEVKHSPWDHDH
ncbi:MAG: zinc ribbon domain-containing protein [Prolixibacteraceae bacterium]|nr:zinc ribbon domain-containing protein [Burkholderiales bacterium]